MWKGLPNVRTVLLFINTPMSTHTHTHTHAPMVTVHGQFPPGAQKQPPASLSGTHTCPFQMPPAKARKAPQPHATFLGAGGLHGPYTQDTGPAMLSASLCPASSKSRPWKWGQVREVSQQRCQPPTLSTPLPQWCSVSAGPCPKLTPQGSTLPTPSDTGWLGGRPESSLQLQPSRGSPAGAGGQPCTPPPLDAAQVWAGLPVPAPPECTCCRCREEGAGAVCRLSPLPLGLPYLWVLSDSPAHPGLLRQRPVHPIPCTPLHLNSRPGEAPVPVSSAVVSDDFLGAGGPCQPPREPRSTKLLVPPTSLLWLLSASIFFLGCVTPSEWLQFLKRQALEFLNFPLCHGA